jgi:hypothetical protein
MIALNFPNAALKALLAHAEATWPLGVKTLYDKVTGRGFWLVGDEGVYLMHNGQRPEGEKPMVVYATECDPTKLDFDDWWNTKRATWGGDDGVEFIAETTIRKIVEDGDDVAFEFDKDQMAILAVINPKKGLQ